MATGTRGSAGRGRRATSRNSGWLIVAAAATVAVVWLGALAFGLPGQRVAGATAADARTAPTTTTAQVSAAVSATTDPALTSAAAPATTSARATTSKPAPPEKTRTTTPTAGPSASITASRSTTGSTTSSTDGSKAPSGAATLPSSWADSPVPGSTPAYGITLADDRSAGQDTCPSTADRPVQTLAPSSAGPLTVALTFDDGPGEATPAVLDVLAREHVHATFFVVGSQVAANPGLVRRASEEGHLIGNHTHDHVYPRDVRGGWTAHYLSIQLRTTAELVRAETGMPTCFFRPPGGFLPSTVLPAARRMRMTTSLWSVDTRDWDVQGAHAPSSSKRAAQARTIAARAVGGGRPGAHPIVLLHDGGGYRGSSAAAVTRIIAWYKAHGYTFVRLDGQV